jgi:hypothetical protein
MIARWVSRRLLLFVAVCLAALAAAGAQAQDPRATAAQNAARTWLALTDKGDSVASWAAASKKFQEQLDEPGWRAALAQAREPLGDPLNRTARATRFDTKLPGGPDGEYAQILFETEYSKGSKVRETVTLEREPDGVWRVMGYLIR